jgi:hypothetical protein
MEERKEGRKGGRERKEKENRNCHRLGQDTTATEQLNGQDPRAERDCE